MQASKFFKNVSVGTATLAIILTLAGCGNNQTTTSSSQDSSSNVQTTEKKTANPVRSANRLIRSENFKDAYNQLSATSNRSKEANNLMTDLQNYMNAKHAYNNRDYQTATASLKEQKSTSPAMRDAMSTLQTKINKKQNTNSSSKAANQAASDQTSSSVVNAFANKMGFTGDKGYQIIPTSTSGNTYKFEVRQNNSDNTVSSLIGIYQYNSKTGAVTKLN